MKTLETAKNNHNKTDILNAEHTINKIEMNIESLKEEIHGYRGKIRYLFFKAVSYPDGTIKFFPEKDLPSGIIPDDHIWRIKIGNTPIPEDTILLTGGGDVVGNIPKGLPSLSIPKLNLNIFLYLFPYAAIISLLGFMEAISIAKAMAGKTGQRLDPNQELIGQGLANIFGAIAKSYPTSGSFSRSAVNLQAGGRYRFVERIYQSGGCCCVVVFYSSPLLPATTCSGRYHNDSGYRAT